MCCRRPPLASLVPTLVLASAVQLACGTDSGGTDETTAGATESSDTADAMDGETGDESDTTGEPEWPQECEGGTVSDVVEAAVQYDATTFDTGTSCLVSQSTQRAGVLSADLECDDQESGPPSEGSISATLSDGDLEVAWLANGERVTVETFDEGVAIRGNDGALRLLWLEGCNADVEASASMATTSWEFGTEAGVCADAPTFEGTDADQPTTVWARSADHDRVDVFHQHAATLPSTLEDGADYALRVSQSLYAFQTGPECYTTTRFLLVALAG